MSIIIHKTPVSPPARATLMVAKILGIEVQTKEVNISLREHYSPEFLEKNPLRTVPVLEDDGFILTDSHAIITYLVSKYGGNAKEKLYPEEIKERAKVDQKLYFDATILVPQLKYAAYDLSQWKMLSEEQITGIQGTYDVLEKYLGKDLFIAVSHMTVADVSCVATLSSLDCVLPVDAKYMNIHRWWNVLKKETWYQDVNIVGLELFQEYIEELKFDKTLANFYKMFPV